MARAASAFDISTKPNPRGRPVSRSLMRASVSTVPWGANSARTDSSVAVKGKLPTNSLVTADFSQYRIEHRQEVPASWIDDALRSGGLWRKEAPGWCYEPRTDRTDRSRAEGQITGLRQHMHLFVDLTEEGRGRTRALENEHADGRPEHEKCRKRHHHARHAGAHLAIHDEGIARHEQQRHQHERRQDSIDDCRPQ
jgi:hypothetical protein